MLETINSGMVFLIWVMAIGLVSLPVVVVVALVKGARDIRGRAKESGRTVREQAQWEKDHKLSRDPATDAARVDSYRALVSSRVAEFLGQYTGPTDHVSYRWQSWVEWQATHYPEDPIPGTAVVAEFERLGLRRERNGE